MDTSNRKILVIGFCGKAKSGKDSAATALEYALKNMGVEVERFAFADPIRRIGRLFEFSDEVMSNQSLKETWKHPWLDVTPRKFMQLVGSEMFRNNLDKDVWVKFMRHRINIFEEYLDGRAGMQLEDSPDGVWSPKAVVIITDLRFPNEAALIKDLGGIIFKIERTNAVTSGEWRQHESEKFVDELPKDATIYNNEISLLGWYGESVQSISRIFKESSICFDNSKYVRVNAV